MINIVLESVQVGVAHPAPGMTLLQFTDASGIVVTVPMTDDIARSVGLQLGTRLAVASGPLPAAPPRVPGLPPAAQGVRGNGGRA